jgi:uncharacterized membrane protein YeaQ/YmgE (transglycosylase-associated protein family)
MSIIAWIVFGAIAGWIASIIAGTNRRQGCLTNIVVGVIGAFVGGLLMEIVTGRGFSFDFSLPSFVVAILGAVILLAIFRRR